MAPVYTPFAAPFIREAIGDSSAILIHGPRQCGNETNYQSCFAANIPQIWYEKRINVQHNKSDLEHHNALAARGYWQAYQSVLACVAKTLKGENAGSIANEQHRNWYRELFAPGVTAGILDAGDLAGYRNASVYIRGSMHVPPRSEAVRDTMPAFFDLLRDEADPSVRVVLGHFIFVYIHPYMDGNGRMGRFLMNLMLASGGYPWTVIPVEERSRYMATLEQASVYQDIVPLAKFLARLVDGKPATPPNPHTP